MSTLDPKKLEAISKIALIRALANSPVEVPVKKESKDDELMAMDDTYFLPSKKK
jgi:hypothetical protein